MSPRKAVQKCPQKKWTSPRKNNQAQASSSKLNSPSKKSPQKSPSRSNRELPNRNTSTPKQQKKLTFDTSTPPLINFDEFDNSPRSWIEMADEEEALMRELLEEKTMDVDLPIGANESNKKKSRKSTPKKTNPNPKFIKTLEMSEPGRRKRHMEDLASPVVRKRLLQSNSNTPNSVQNLSPNPKEGWEDPKLGWCYDEKILARRTKEIEKGKEKSIYIRYVKEVPRLRRDKKIHPKTPNKYINYSRRSWDALVRKWKKDLYSWAGEDPSPSCNTSFCGSDVETDSIMGDIPEEENQNEQSPMKSRTIKDINVVLNTPDQMASLLGHFDMDTRRVLFDDESTLKASNQNQSKAKINGPVDFSMLKH